MMAERSILAPERLVKQPAESRLYSCDFANLLSGATVLDGTTGGGTLTVVEVGTTALTIGSIALNGAATGVVARISGGTDGNVYRIAWKSTDDAGNTLVVDTLLRVVD
jgi:hypothetical protein